MAYSLTKYDKLSAMERGFSVTERAYGAGALALLLFLSSCTPSAEEVDLLERQAQAAATQAAALQVEAQAKATIAVAEVAIATASAPTYTPEATLTPTATPEPSIEAHDQEWDGTVEFKVHDFYQPGCVFTFLGEDGWYDYDSKLSRAPYTLAGEGEEMKIIAWGEFDFTEYKWVTTEAHEEFCESINENPTQITFALTEASTDGVCGNPYTTGEGIVQSTITLSPNSRFPYPISFCADLPDQTK